jgi:hypothetical protein
MNPFEKYNRRNTMSNNDQSADNNSAPITDDETQASDGRTNTADDHSNKTKKNIFINDSKDDDADQIGKPELKP